MCERRAAQPLIRSAQWATAIRANRECREQSCAGGAGRKWRGCSSFHRETRTRTGVLWAMPEENPPASRDLHATGAEAERGSVLAWTSALPLAKRTAK